MSYKFNLTKNIHMYNHLITCITESSEKSCICESTPERIENILFWPDDFGFTSEEIEKVIVELEIWLNNQNIKYKIIRGKRI